LVEIHDDHYLGVEKPPDHVWLQMTAERGWVAVSHDANIRHTSRSRKTIAKMGVRLIVAVSEISQLSVLRREVSAEPPTETGQGIPLGGSFPFPPRGGKGTEGMEGDGIDAVSPATRWALTTPAPTAPGKEGSSSKF
jgi:hypothetical protein